MVQAYSSCEKIFVTQPEVTEIVHTLSEYSRMYCRHKWTDSPQMYKQADSLACFNYMNSRVQPRQKGTNLESVRACAFGRYIFEVD